jgi:hypothetical protein
MPGLMVDAWARYGVEADSPWATEIARRMFILFGYDFHLNGVAEDNVDGGIVTNGKWFEAAHLMPMRAALRTLAWMPEVFGPARENHIVRSSAVVSGVCYGRGRIGYTTFDAPAGVTDVLRLAFEPQAIRANGQALARRSDLSANGYTARSLPCGDSIVTIRHDGLRQIEVEGPDPGRSAAGSALQYTGEWQAAGDERYTSRAGASASFTFEGNQVQLLGGVSPAGGQADIYLDGQRQPAGLDGWNPLGERTRQVLYSMSGLENRRHELRVVCRGSGNPRSAGARVSLHSVQWSDAAGVNGSGEGGGPVTPQRMIFGYPRPVDYQDGAGNAWRPGCEFVVRSGAGIDSVARAWWTTPAAGEIAGTPDPELYRYGVHAPEFTVYITVGPGRYRATLRWAASPERKLAPGNRMDVVINDRTAVEDLDVAGRAGGPGRALDLVFADLMPLHGTIAIRFKAAGTSGAAAGEAFIQAIEIEPQAGR